MSKHSDHFYIGWQDKAPIENRKTVRRFIGWITILVLAVPGVLVLTQKGFADSVFELGRLTEMEGILRKNPVPVLQVVENNAKKSILLVGFGKAGAEATIEAIEAQQKMDLDGQTVKLKGTLIYYQDKTVMELSQGVDAFLGISDRTLILPRYVEDFGAVSLRGEILDPKCALGVMKPGYGKPHRSCAVRCISGGIPPIFRVTTADNQSNYCILKGENGEKINEEILPYVADQLRLCGRLEQQDDWLVFYLNPAEDILRLKPHWVEGDISLCN